MTKATRARLRETLVRVKVERSRSLRTALSRKAKPAFDDFADAVLDLYKLLDELDIEAIEKI